MVLTVVKLKEETMKKADTILWMVKQMS